MIRKDHSITVKGIECVNSLGTWYNITLDDFPYLFRVVSDSNYGLYDINMLAMMSYVSLDERIYKTIKHWELVNGLKGDAINTWEDILS